MKKFSKEITDFNFLQTMSAKLNNNQESGTRNGKIINYYHEVNTGL